MPAAAATADAQGRRLRVLVLHGSQQDGSIFAQRLRNLAKKISAIAELHFVDAPNVLPLAPGQSVPMRAWWRHWGLQNLPPASDGDAEVGDAATGAPGAQASAAHAAEEALEHLAAGWEGVVVRDWAASLAVLQHEWAIPSGRAPDAGAPRGGFDGVLGFSNGAAAAMLLAAHAAADASGRYASLRFIICACGYVPMPLQKLAPPQLVAANRLELAAPLEYASLHIMGAADPVISAAQSEQLAACFVQAGRQVLLHSGGHYVPQQAAHCDTIAAFMRQFLNESGGPAASSPRAGTAPPLRPPHPSGFSGAAAAGAAGSGAAAAMASAADQRPPLKEAERDEPCAASEEQLEELEALKAIFAEDFHLISEAPPRFTIKLREPGAGSDSDDGAGASGAPSRLFTLVLQLPKGYPADALPTTELIGPLGGRDPARAQLAAHLRAVAEEQCSAMAGAGYAFQLVDAAREWLDEHMSVDVGQRHASGQAGAAGAAAAAAHGGGSVAVDGDGDGCGGRWWEKEEADVQLMAEAIAAAARVSWQAWSVPPPPAGPAAPEQADGADGSVPASAVGTGAGAAAASADAADHWELHQRGRWDYCIGLVGKPSAGKSTLFNAWTDPARPEDEAAVGSYPFTTIEPNVGRAFVALPDPCLTLGVAPERCHPAHGFARGFDPAALRSAYTNAGPLMRLLQGSGWGDKALWRRVAVTVKDVAGLVPGAYKGRGRGNAFLNDLCDADVLVHVVDASGATDCEGAPCAPGEGSDPLTDIAWVRQEVHRWVFNNVAAKWPQVAKRPSRLPELFSGYRASRALVAQVLARSGLSLEALLAEGHNPQRLASWGERQVHELVALFVAARFPILLALNKADVPQALERIAAVRRALPHDPVVAVSAASERWLCQQRRMGGRVLYEPGASEASLAPCPADSGAMDVGDAAVVARRLEAMQQRVLGVLGGTGALAAITGALALRPPRWVLPVGDRATLAALPARGGMGGAAKEGRVLSDCILMRPGSTVEDVFLVLKRPPYQLLEGDFVRAEALVAAAPAAVWRVVRKDEEVAVGAVLIILSNKKVAWQSSVSRR